MIKLGAVQAMLAVMLLGGCPDRPPRRPRVVSDLGRMPPLIPRQLLFAGQGRAKPAISPDGRRLAYLSPVKGVVNVWVRTRGKSDDRPVTRDTRRSIGRYFWAMDSRSLFYLQDHRGDENDRLHRVDLTTGRITVLTPKGVRARIVAVSKHHPQQLLVAMNQRRRSLFDVYRLDLATGRLTLDTPNPGRVVGWHVDFQYRVRAARAINPSGRSELLVRDRPGAPWRVVRTWSPLEQGRPVTFSRDGRSLVLLDNLGRDKARLIRLDLTTGKVTELCADKRADLSRRVLIHPDKLIVQAIGMNYLKLRWKMLDPGLRADFALLAKQAGRLTFRVRVGDRKRDRRMLRQRSPLHFAHRIRTPLLIFQGKNDPRVKPAESEQIVRAIRRRGGKVGYVFYPDEGHGLRRAANRLDFAGRVEAFLGRHLGGRVEPYVLQQGTSAEVR